MIRTCAMLSLSVVLCGCGTIGNIVSKTGQVLMDPSIQVGAGEDQPTQIALSLYAYPAVNSNTTADQAGAVSDGGRGAAESEPDGEASRFTVQFNSATRRELIDMIDGALSRLQQENAMSPDFPPLPAGGPNPGHATIASTGADDAGDLPGWLGQYRTTPALPDKPAASRRSYVSTPIAFKILQLRDDSLLLNADPEALKADLKKTLGSTYVGADDYILLPGQFKFIEFQAIHADTRYIAVFAEFHAPTPAAIKQVLRIEPRARRYALLVTLLGTRVDLADETPPAQITGSVDANHPEN